eukprot:CAMPEP_0198295136 /NCGR_PEP_ID=MMETSP1449-20131203/26029_1 /TAXON_ID=420275 /ORGANISM="Attheya septentrionalis, Strain CCMP2084" /LENGTH=764 /DNA_ID=CAMNT_0043995333 /DNA_START=83 /DNA_END=2374 /DNA_ORIENTATION=+
MDLKKSDSSEDDNSTSVEIRIIVHVTEEFAQEYQMVQDEYEGNIRSPTAVAIRFLHESQHQSFANLLEECLRKEPPPSPQKEIMKKYDSIDSTSTKGKSMVMFLTDDCILLYPLHTVIKTAQYALFHTDGSEGRISCFLSRLHSGITWCQTKQTVSPPPKHHMHHVCSIPSSAAREDGFLTYERRWGREDWAYPFDLSGGAYIRQDMLTLLDGMESSQYSHPNRFEIHGNAAFASLFLSPKTRIAVPTRPYGLILAINRVQDVCQAPIASTDSSYSGLADPKSLKALLHEKKHLDLDRYRATHFNASHIGALFLEQTTSGSIDASFSLISIGHSSAPLPSVSVLIPVHSGPPSAAEHALLSILMQPMEEYLQHASDTHFNLLLSPMQVVLVDDRCADGSIDAMLAAANILSSTYASLSLVISDHRSSHNKKPGYPGETIVKEEKLAKSMCPAIYIDIVKSPRKGISSALNFGLTYCRSEFVARMDADDIAAPGRIISQLAALKANPSLSVLGMSTNIFRERDGAEHDGGTGDEYICTLPYRERDDRVIDGKQPPSTTSHIIRTSLPPTDTGFAAWSMLFSCTVSHPSVMFRKTCIKAICGYEESIQHAEDYHLWLKLTTQDCQSIRSLPDIGLWHRKHALLRAKSVNKSQKQLEETAAASEQAMLQLFNHANPNPMGHHSSHILAATLRKPDTAHSTSQLDEAANLLLQLEIRFLKKWSASLTECEVELIRLDCSERLGELATVLVHKFGRAAMKGDKGAWGLW